MSLVQLFIQYEVAKVLVTELGELGIIQFCDVLLIFVLLSENILQTHI